MKVLLSIWTTLVHSTMPDGKGNFLMYEQPSSVCLFYNKGRTYSVNKITTLLVIEAYRLNLIQKLEGFGLKFICSDSSKEPDGNTKYSHFFDSPSPINIEEEKLTAIFNT